MRKRQIWGMGLALLLLCFVSAESGIGFFGNSKVKSRLNYNDYSDGTGVSGSETLASSTKSTRKPYPTLPANAKTTDAAQAAAGTNFQTTSATANAPSAAFPESPPPTGSYDSLASQTDLNSKGPKKKTIIQTGGSVTETITVAAAPDNADSRETSTSGSSNMATSPALGIAPLSTAATSTSSSTSGSSVSKADALVAAAQSNPSAALSALENQCQWTVMGFTGLISLDGVESSGQSAPRYDVIPQLSSQQNIIGASEIGVITGISGGRNLIDSVLIQSINRISNGRSCISAKTINQILSLSGGQNVIMGPTPSLKGNLDQLTQVSGGLTLIKSMKINRISGGTGGVLILEDSEVTELSDFEGTIYIKNATVGTVVRSQQPIIMP